MSTPTPSAPFPPPTGAPAPVGVRGPNGSTPRWLPGTALAAGLIGIVGALLPALDGQRVGDPASAAYRIGLPIGLVGALLALWLGIRALATPTRSAPASAVAVAAIVCGGLALVLSAALAFSG